MSTVPTIRTRRLSTKNYREEITLIPENASKDSLIGYVNFIRHYYHLPPLAINKYLEKVAQKKARHITAYNSKTIHSYVRPWNILMDGAIPLINQQTILDESCNEIGISIARRTYQGKRYTFAVQVIA